MGDFINTIDALGDEETLRRLVSDTLTEYCDDFEITKICSRAFTYKNKLQSLELPNTKIIDSYACNECRNLETIDIPKAEILNLYALSTCDILTNVIVTGALRFDQFNFKGTPVGIVNCPKVTSLGTYIGNSYGASGFDFLNKITINQNTFNGAFLFSTLILRSSTLCPLSHINAFADTPIGNGFGWIYVPSELVSTYKTATNWSSFADQIVSIDEYPKEFVGGTITDTWAQIFAAEANGTYKTKYSIGDTKALNINGACVLMQIAAFDEDDLADNSGKAKITWISVGAVATLRMNDTGTTSGGWAECEVRRYVQQVIFQNIENVVRNSIKMVTKISHDAQNNSNINTTDSVWIPSFYEVTGDSSRAISESSGASYTGLFGNVSTNSPDRIRSTSPCGYSGGATWWLRSSNNSSAFAVVNTLGSAVATTNYAVNRREFIIGFCT